jgi:hypothetical protein
MLLSTARAARFFLSRARGPAGVEAAAVRAPFLRKQNALHHTKNITSKPRSVRGIML